MYIHRTAKNKEQTIYLIFSEKTIEKGKNKAQNNCQSYANVCGLLNSAKIVGLVLKQGIRSAKYDI